MGWSYTGYYDVKNSKTGQTGIRYVLSPNVGSSDVGTMRTKMEDLLGTDNVIFSQGTHRYAPEMTKLSMIVLDNSKVQESKKRVNENIYKDQWGQEIKLFFKGLRNGQALVDNDIIAVEWGHNDTDPRYIYYKVGDNRLTDEHFSVQHSRPLTPKEMTVLRHFAANYGIEIPEVNEY